MALQVWLPLNGTLENKGLSNVTVTNNGATVDNNGKIGKCYSVDGSSHYIQGPSFTVPASGEFSVSGWYYHTANKTWARLFEFTNLDVNGVPSNKTCTGLGLLNGTTPTSFNILNGSQGSNVSTGKAFTTGKWYHWAVTYNKANVKIYIDGELIKELTFRDYAGSVFTYTFFGKSSWTGDQYLNGKMNDLRIYNHALSPKEVKEISKGLILHYKLDGNDIGMTIPRNGGLIPDGVKLYDYILSSGTLYIDTGANVSSTSRVVTKMRKLNTNTQHFFGARDADSAGAGYAAGIVGSNFISDYNGRITISTASAIANKDILIDKNGNSIKVTVDGTTTTYTNTAATFTVSNTMNIFNIHGLSLGGFDNLRVYNFQLYNNSVLVRNMLPCTYLGEPGMWDTVENKFYRNQGTGLFTLGNKITLKEYEYLLMQGTYINTGVTPNLDTRILAELLLYNNELTAIFGSRITTGGNCGSFMVWNGTNDAFAFLYGHNGWDLGKFAIAPTANTRFTIDLNKNVGTLSTGSTKIYNYHTFSSNCPLVIGSTNTSGTIDNRYTKEHVYYFKMYNNGKLVRDFIPVSYNGTPGLWDKVEWKFYANAGSGSFTLGPEKTVQQDAPIFYDSSGYCNHGSITGTLTTNSDSPRYTKSTVFNGSSGINAGHTAKVTDAITISYWAKTSTEGVAVSCTQNGGFSSSSNGTFYMYANGTYGTIPNGGAWNNNAWHHIVNTFDGRYKKIYKDGALAATLDLGAKYAIQYAALAPIWIGAESLNSNTPTTPYFNGSISDVRIYATALSEDDIKELYNTSAFVTNNGVFAEYELYEDNLSDVKKTGLLETANFYENGAESGYALDTDKTRVASNYIISEDFIEI